MDKNYKPVYIRGTETGNGVIKALENLGGKNEYYHKGNKKTYIYFIDPETNAIDYVIEDSLFGRYVKSTAKEIQPVKWRAKEGDTYYMISASLFVLETTDDRDSIDHDVYNSGNYFKTKEEAEKVLKKIKPYFHDNI